MKKSLLFAAAITCAMAASAQNYTVQAYTSTDDDWDSSYESAIMLDKAVTVEVYDSYVILKGWLGTDSQDLKVEFDADENVTAVTPITLDVEGDTFTSGYAEFSTLASNYYYTQLYLGEGYDYAFADSEGGYVTLSGYFYSDQTTYVWAYYNIEWSLEGKEALYSVEAETSENEDWGSPFLPGTKVNIDVYEDALYLSGWCGAEGYDLSITFDADENIVSVTPVINGEEQGAVELGDYANTLTGNSEYYYASIPVFNDYAYAAADDEGGYVLFQGYFYKDETSYDTLNYYIEWEKESGIAKVSVSKADGPVEYFNLQGVRVNNPAAGQIVIKRQGDNVTKTIVR